jgi:hypothetical protein
MNRSAALALLVPALAMAAPVPKAKAPEIDIRDPDGKVLLAADDLVSYDWGTHTLTLKDGAKEPFAKALTAAKRFAVCIDGKPAVEGQYVSPVVSSTRKGPVISLLGGEKGEDCTVSIQGGYPGLREGDPDLREVKELKAALEKAGKLKGEK